MLEKRQRVDEKGRGEKKGEEERRKERKSRGREGKRSEREESERCFLSGCEMKNTWDCVQSCF